MLLLAKHLPAFGYQVLLAYGKYSVIAEVKEEFQKYCERIYELNARHKHDPRHYFELKRVLEEGGFDLIHLHLWNPGACRYAYRAARNTKTPIVTTEHDYFELRGWKRLIKKSCLKNVGQTVAINHDTAGQIVQDYGVPEDHVQVVPNGIEAEAMLDRMLDNYGHSVQHCLTSVLPHKNWLNEKILDMKLDMLDNVSNIVQHEKSPLKEGDIVVTCVAELHPRKGHKYLIEAFNKLKKEISRLQLVLVGAGPLLRELVQKYAQEPQIHFMGWQEEVPMIIHCSDIFVLPSLREAFGLVILEAMACGTIVVATDNGGPREIIEQGKTGFLIPPANADRMVDALKTILQNPDQQRDIEKAALEQVRTQFSAKKMAEETARVYEKLIHP